MRLSQRLGDLTGALLDLAGNRLGAAEPQVLEVREDLVQVFSACRSRRLSVRSVDSVRAPRLRSASPAVWVTDSRGLLAGLHDGLGGGAGGLVDRLHRLGCGAADRLRGVRVLTLRCWQAARCAR